MIFISSLRINLELRFTAVYKYWLFCHLFLFEKNLTSEIKWELPSPVPTVQCNINKLIFSFVQTTQRNSVYVTKDRDKQQILTHEELEPEKVSAW